MKVSRIFFTFLSGLFFCLFSFSALADNVKLYDSPKPDGKIISQIDLSSGIIPVFQSKDPKEQDWLKVADPRNGNVGWINKKDLKGKSVNFTLSQTVLPNDKNQTGYQIVQFSNQTPFAQPVTPEQSHAMIQKFQAQQAEMEKSMQMTMNTLLSNMNGFIKQQNQMLEEMNQHLLSMSPLTQPDSTPKNSGESSLTNTKEKSN